ncbi:transposase [Mesorhizobium intechi]|uniref:Transposase n=1 Tax=Mesorhizobium intechi TaxID=537601 RepID=A0A8T9AMJ4_9HYPH|nr:transposase [Mesorhizobium intechi]
MRLAFCLAHARRKFVDVIKLTGSPKRSRSWRGLRRSIASKPRSAARQHL